MHTVNWMNNLDNFNNQSTHLTDKDKMIFFPKYEDASLEIKKSLLIPKETKDFICLSLFKLFINNNGSLKNLNIKCYDNYNYYYGLYFLNIYGLILDYPNFISNVETFYF